MIFFLVRYVKFKEQHRLRIIHFFTLTYSFGMERIIGYISVVYYDHRYFQISL